MAGQIWQITYLIAALSIIDAAERKSLEEHYVPRQPCG